MRIIKRMKIHNKPTTTNIIRKTRKKNKAKLKVKKKKREKIKQVKMKN